ncbi:MAG: hypothetical protein II949_15545 [Prevotella sp.]|nr:hypothetical protein [Prevotella sp.]
MTKRLSLCISLFLLLSLSLTAQKRTTMATLYREFRPSTITLKDGRTLKQSLTNVFLKNSSLLYLKGEYTMEANMENIVAVDFDDRSFVNLNGQLAFLIDSVGKNRLFCIELFDQETYERNLRNNVNISSVTFGGDQLSTSTVDLNNEDDYKLPVFRHYYYLLDGAFVKVHERELMRKISKEQRTMMKRIIGLPDFSWQSESSLLQLLKAISE